MARIVLEIHRNGNDGKFFAFLTEPTGYPRGSELFPFAYDQADPEPTRFADGTLGTDDIGDYILRKLSEHPAIVQAFSTVGTKNGSSAPIYVRIDALGEGIPWETLFANQSFVALDPRWPIGRVSLSMPGSPSAGARMFRPPARVLAVLAAAGIDATQEWFEIRHALGKLPFEVDVLALVAQDKLLHVVRTGNPRNLSVTAEFVGPGRELIGQVTGFRPNILHFFCHGGAAGSPSSLDIATRSTANRSRGGVSFELNDFPVGNPTDDLWLVVINACEGAHPAEGTGSLVSSLADRGVPAVAGMREVVSVDDAHAFSKGFYRALVEMLAPLGSAGGPVTVDWPAALREARLQICEKHRGNDSCTVAARRLRQWAQPVMYVGLGEFTLEKLNSRIMRIDQVGPPTASARREDRP